MNQENKKDLKVEQILSSLDGLERAQPQAWFYTRLRARLEKQRQSIWEKTSQFLSKPAIAFATLCTVLVVNIVFLVAMNSSGNQNSQVAQADPVQDSESLIASSSSFDYENITP